MSAPDEFDETPFFYAIRRRFWFREQLFRVYLNHQMLAAAYVAGQVHEPLYYWEAFARLSWMMRLIMPLIRRSLRRRYEREEFYDLVDPFGHELTTFDQRNFQIPADSIIRIQFDHKHVLHVQQCIGVLRLTAFDRPKLRLIAIGFESAETIIERLRELDCGLEVAGPNYDLSPFEREIANQRRETAWSNLGVAMAFAGIFAMWATELISTDRLLLSLAICLISCLWISIKSRSLRSTET